MAFKLPSFGLLGRPIALKRNSLFDNLPQFSWDDISDKEEIGRGSFGCVFTAKPVTPAIAILAIVPVVISG